MDISTPFRINVVFNVVFSPTMEGRMTSCGAGHIKCWKMDIFTPSLVLSEK